MVCDPNKDNTNNDSFYLSKPLWTNFQININKIKMSSTIIINYSQLLPSWFKIKKNV
jgi:hypothetical protein